MRARSITAMLVFTLACASAAHAQDTAASCRQFCDRDARACRDEAHRQGRAEENADSGSSGRQEDAIGGNERRAARDEGIRSRLSERLGRCDTTRTSCQRQCAPAQPQPQPQRASGG